jgi:hypothetical protein
MPYFQAESAQDRRFDLRSFSITRRGLDLCCQLIGQLASWRLRHRICPK